MHLLNNSMSQLIIKGRKKEKKKEHFANTNKHISQGSSRLLSLLNDSSEQMYSLHQQKDFIVFSYPTLNKAKGNQKCCRIFRTQKAEFPSLAPEELCLACFMSLVNLIHITVTDNQLHAELMS